MKLSQKDTLWHTVWNFRVLLHFSKVQLPHLVFKFRKVKRSLLRKNPNDYGVKKQFEGEAREECGIRRRSPEKERNWNVTDRGREDVSSGLW